MGHQSNFSKNNKCISYFEQYPEAGFTTEYAGFHVLGQDFAKQGIGDKTFPCTRYLTHQIPTNLASFD